MEKIQRVDEPTKVYNFSVADYHTYFVSDLQVWTHNSSRDCGLRTAVDIELKYKEGWTTTQKAEADAKVDALTKANTIKTPPQRSGTSAASRYKKTNGQNSVTQGQDVDHTIDLQLGGADEILNMSPLDSSVNRSLGSQIQNKIKGYPNGTYFDKFTIR